jgi:hypothetical protein
MLRVGLVALVSLALALGVVTWLAGPALWAMIGPWTHMHRSEAAAGDRPDPNREYYPDPNSPGTSARVFIDRREIDSDVAATMFFYKGTIRDTNSLQELRDALRGRGRRGLADLRRQFDQLKLDGSPTFDDRLVAMRLSRLIAFTYMYEGKMAEASAWLQKGMAFSRTPGMPPDLPGVFQLLLGVASMREGEVENCLECTGPSSCIFPIDVEARHRQQSGSRQAIAYFTDYLKQEPGDLRVRWLLNVAYMTLGEYPEHVPSGYLIPLDPFRSEIDVGRFENVAARAGLNVRGPKLAGGNIFDDFNNDGLLDVFISSVDTEQGAALFLNKGDGTFEDRSSWAGLADQIYALNVSRADFDNDGNLDVLLMRGAWESAARLSLLRNKGGRVFEDVTIAAGLAEPIATESSVWGDYDNDGRLDLFVCGDYLKTKNQEPDPRCKSRLYHNQGNGTFANVTDLAGVTNAHWAKGSAWGDYDRDGRLDLFVSNMDGPCRLFHNEGHGKFRDVAAETGISKAEFGMPFACWFWDYDNDGWSDLFVNDYKCSLAETIADYQGIKLENLHHPHLFRNLEGKGFHEVSAEVGLVRPISAMGVNFGDIDNDGFLDVYFGTGWMSFSGLIPKVMMKNVEGRRFADVTDSSHTGHLQKGHGTSFGDWDCDGDVDILAVLGGAYASDTAYSVLFQNPGHGRHWLKVKLVGVQTNRSAIGARIEADIEGADGHLHRIFRTVGDNASFGGNPLTEHIGLGDGLSVAKLVITWPVSQTVQTFTNVAADRLLVITEGNNTFQVVHQKAVTPPKN